MKVDWMTQAGARAALARFLQVTYRPTCVQGRTQGTAGLAYLLYVCMHSYIY